MTTLWQGIIHSWSWLPIKILLTILIVGLFGWLLVADEETTANIIGSIICLFMLAAVVFLVWMFVCWLIPG